jgi:hypothetical protein
MQLGHEDAIIPILRRHQRRGLPGCRDDHEPRAVDMTQIGAKAARLHRHRTIRQPDRGDVGVLP